MNTNFDFGSLKDRVKWKRAFAFFLSMVLLLTSIAIPDAPFGSSMTAHASASGDAGEDPRGEYYKKPSFPISYLEQEEIHEITAEGYLGSVNAVTWYQFTPEETALYTFKGSWDKDLYGAIYTKNVKQNCYERIAYDKYNYDGNTDDGYKITETLQAGTTYYFCAGYERLHYTPQYWSYFYRTYILSTTKKINGIAREGWEWEHKAINTTPGKSYILEADVRCVDDVTPTYEWFATDLMGENHIPLSAIGNKYIYTESGNRAETLYIYCKVTAGTHSETLGFSLNYSPIKVLYSSIDGNIDNFCQYQVGHTYSLKVNALSIDNRPLTYTWYFTDGIINTTILQTGPENTFSFTPTEIFANTNFEIGQSIICSISDDKGNEISYYIDFRRDAIANIKQQVNGQDIEDSFINVFQEVPYTLEVSASAEKGKTLTYVWKNENDSILGTGQTYQYMMNSKTTNETIYCSISDGRATYNRKFCFSYAPIANPILTVNNSSASGNAIPVHRGETYQLKVAAQTAPGKTLTYQWGTIENDEFTALPGETKETYTCNITNTEDIRSNLVCYIKDSDGNSIQQKCYMKYKPIYDIERSIDDMPVHSLKSRIGQNYILTTKAKGEDGKTLTYSWYVNGTKVSDGNTYAYTAKSSSERISCRIYDGTNNYETNFYISPFDTTAYDFTIKDIPTNVAYAYEGEKVILELKDKYAMAENVDWNWGDVTVRHKNPVIVTMGKNIIKGNCKWEDGDCEFLLLPCTNHTYTAKGTNPATATADGATTVACSKCGHTRSSAIAKVTNIKLSKTSLDYTGKNQNLTLNVSDRTGRQLKAGTDYDYTFNGKKNGNIIAKNVGKYTVKVTFKGNYSGTKELTFTISPQKVMLSKVSATKKGFKAVWKKSKAKVTGYEISYSTNKSFKKKATKTVPIKGYKVTSKTVKKLKAKTTYYVKVRAYQNIKAGKKTVKLYSKWSSAKQVKTRK